MVHFLLEEIILNPIRPLVTYLDVQISNLKFEKSVTNCSNHITFFNVYGSVVAVEIWRRMVISGPVGIFSVLTSLALARTVCVNNKQCKAFLYRLMSRADQLNANEMKRKTIVSVNVCTKDMWTPWMSKISLLSPLMDKEFDKIGNPK